MKVKISKADAYASWQARALAVMSKVGSVLLCGFLRYVCPAHEMGEWG